MRVLGRTRLSRSSEESTSIERQREIIESWANQHDHEIVGWAEDVDVSGSVDPFDTPELGSWLSDERKGEWDILCAWKMDRLARRTVPLHRLIGWTQDNDKTLVCIADNIDLSHWVGRLVASVIAGVAEGELEAIRERNAASHKKLREVGRWHGGQVIYGYTPAPHESGGWILVHDPEQVAVIHKVADLIIAGRSVRSIVTELNEAGTPSPRGKAWGTSALLRLLRNKALLGWSIHNGETIRDGEGRPVLKGPPILTGDQFNQLQAAIKTNDNWTRSAKSSPLLDVAFCWDCGGKLYYQRTKRKGAYYVYYYCPARCYTSINGDALIDITYSLFESELGDRQRLQKKITRAVDHSERILEIQDAISELSRLLGSLGSATAIATISEQIEAMDKELARLEQEHSTEERVEWIPTGDTYQELWDDLDTEGRRQLLLQAEIKILARPMAKGTRVGRGTVETDFQIPRDLQEVLW